MTDPMLTQIENYVRARFPAIVLQSPEETRIIPAIIDQLTSQRYQKARFYSWDLASGLVRLANNGVAWVPQEVSAAELGEDASDKSAQSVTGADIASLYMLFQAVVQIPIKPGETDLVVFFVKDADKLLNRDTTEGLRDRRALRNILPEVTNMKRTMLFISPEFAIPSDLKQEMTRLDFPLPTRQELMNMLIDKANTPAVSDRVPVELSGGIADKVVDAMTGLTMTEATNALFYAIVSCQALNDTIVPVLLAAKEQIVKQSKLEYYHPDVTDQDVGGLDRLKAHVKIVRSAFTQEARLAGVPRPRGTIVVGPPGTGKSLMAKVVGGGYMPILRMDLGAMMGRYYGDSEGALRQALKIAGAVAPCVLWIDEVEKAIGSGGATEGREVEQRMLAALLTWMQENTDPVYVFATSNDVRGLNEALLSRFDEVFSAVLPDLIERQEIFAIHLRRNKLDPAAFDLPALAAATPNYAGREIVKAVEKAIMIAYASGSIENGKTVVTNDHVLQATTTIKPVAAMRKDDIQAIIDWGEQWAQPASTPRDIPELIVNVAARRTAALGRANDLAPDL